MSGMAKGAGGRSRRRGTDLEDAILDAAWRQLVTEGYGRFTFEAVAALARTSKPVLYRRWSTRPDLLRATIRRRGATSSVRVPDTGNVRDDLLEALRAANAGRSNMVGLMMALISNHFDDIGLTPAQLRAELVGDRETSIERILARAAQRGEIDPGRLTPRIVDLPFALFRHEYFMTFRPVPDEVLIEIIDDIFLPLVAPERPRAAAKSRRAAGPRQAAPEPRRANG